MELCTLKDLIGPFPFGGISIGSFPILGISIVSAFGKLSICFCEIKESNFMFTNVIIPQGFFLGAFSKRIYLIFNFTFLLCIRCAS